MDLPARHPTPPLQLQPPSLHFEPSDSAHFDAVVECHAHSVKGRSRALRAVRGSCCGGAVRSAPVAVAAGAGGRGSGSGVGSGGAAPTSTGYQRQGHALCLFVDPSEAVAWHKARLPRDAVLVDVQPWLVEVGRAMAVFPSTLRSLSLVNIRLGREASLALARGVASHKALEALDLRIGARGVDFALFADDDGVRALLLAVHESRAPLTRVLVQGVTHQAPIRRPGLAKDAVPLHAEALVLALRGACVAEEDGTQQLGNSARKARSARGAYHFVARDGDARIAHRILTFLREPSNMTSVLVGGVGDPPLHVSFSVM